ncbi:hypothetical protein NLG97_g2481 [Lecanicillium saksenae]|uniref:Uncharacterized protein n=1 Tax=Lecanicillium saksenae TaxID=468837 RepID=A0ACC1R0S9_9HYPO|nr:hypothetical protein NLG97_g2481 [Lecanicillium saksenae]
MGILSNIELDVAVIGAGISGIDAAYHLRQRTRRHSWAVFESRDDIGGTWNLFRYPGCRSDSDLYTYGFSWNPWLGSVPIASASAIAQYISESAKLYGIDKKIRFHHHLLRANWSTKDCFWTLKFQVQLKTVTVTARFVIFATGYYDHHAPLPAIIPGIETFSGTVLYPQFWPKDFDYSGKNIVIIGSGATAISLLPALARKAARTTMLQRSPSYVLSMRNYNPERLMCVLFPPCLRNTANRLYWAVYSRAFFSLCRRFPAVARWYLRLRTEAELPEMMHYNPDFKPKYDPWEERLLISPDGDFYTALREEATEIKTDTICRVTATGIQLDSGDFLDADIIIPATGLKLQIAGGCDISIDGERVDFGAKLMWRGTMVQDVPNATFIIGYTNASWTLAADVSCVIACRMLHYLQKRRLRAVIPRLGQTTAIKRSRLLHYSSSYVCRAEHYMPKVGNQGPWKLQHNYVKDIIVAQCGYIFTSLELITEGHHENHFKAKPKDTRFNPICLPFFWYLAVLLSISIMTAIYKSSESVGIPLTTVR